MAAPTRVLVTGDRNWRCTALAERVVDRLIARYGSDLVVVHGAATGVEAAFDQACLASNVARDPHPADWTYHGDRAGLLRNQAMVDLKPAFCIAVHRTLDRSRETKDCVRRCLSAGIPVYVLDAEDAEPRRATSMVQISHNRVDPDA